MKLFGFDEDIEDLCVKPEASTKCTMCGDCERYARDVLNAPGAFEVTTVEGTFDFTYETNGAYPPKKLLLTTIDVLARRVAFNKERFLDALRERREAKRSRSGLQ